MTSHLVACEQRFWNEKARLDAATNPNEIEMRTVWVRQALEEVEAEIEFLANKGIIIPPFEPYNTESIDDILAELLD